MRLQICMIPDVVLPLIYLKVTLNHQTEVGKSDQSNCLLRRFISTANIFFASCTGKREIITVRDQPGGNQLPPLSETHSLPVSGLARAILDSAAQR